MSVISADRLCELRTEMAISQKSAAEKLGVSQALLSHYEKGIREFNLDFLCRVADFYGVTADYILGRSDSRTGLTNDTLDDRVEDSQFTTASIYRAAIMTHERMSAGSFEAGTQADMLYALTVYRILFASSRHGYIPKRWFSISPKYTHAFSLALTESLLHEFPEKNGNARRYGGPEPKSIETLIHYIESYMRRFVNTVGKEQ